MREENPLHGMMLRAAARDGDDDDDEEQANFLPKEFVCPITQELLEDPVIAEDGFSYERIAMERWFSTGKTRSPVTSERMEGRSLTPNKVMKAMIQNYRRELGTRLLQSCDALASESAAADGASSSSSSSSSSSRSGSSDAPPQPLTARTLAAFQEGGADLNVRDGDGNTPLLLLLQAGQLKLAEDLLTFNARASQRNDLGTAPLDLCQSIRSERLAREGGGDGSAAEGRGAGLRVSVKEWDRMIALLEARTTREALEDEEREKVRHGNQMRQRQRQADLDQVNQVAIQPCRLLFVTCTTLSEDPLTGIFPPPPVTHQRARRRIRSINSPTHTPSRRSATQRTAFSRATVPICRPTSGRGSDSSRPFSRCSSKRPP